MIQHQLVEFFTKFLYIMNSYLLDPNDKKGSITKIQSLERVEYDM